MKYGTILTMALILGFAFVQSASASVSPTYPAPLAPSKFCHNVAHNGPVEWSVYLEQGLGITHMGAVDSAELDELISFQSDDAQAILKKFKTFVAKVDNAVQIECSKPSANSAYIYKMYTESINSGKHMLTNKYNPNLLQDFEHGYVSLSFS